jgi:nitrate/nitrite transporter NarK
MKKKWRFPMLFLCAFMVVGPYFCYDFPGALENKIEIIFEVSSIEYASLYSWYATPNVILPLLGGILFDKIGTANAITLFSLFMVTG